MPIINRIAELHDEITAWRRDFHTDPELLYDVHRTAGAVARRLREFGCNEVVEGIGRTGVVGIIEGNGRDSGAGTIGLRADMDALPILEASGKPWASKNEGKMHACGHDGHTAMLLGAARYLCETRNFSGRVAVIFQPAEEGGAGGRAMVQDGLMEKFSISEVYGMHNLPGLPVGEFATRPGAMMASTDGLHIAFVSDGGHAAMPHQGRDPIVAAAHCVTALQTIVSRNTDPIHSLVISVTQFHAGTAHNIIPDRAVLNGTIRSLDPQVRAQAKQRIKEIAEGVAAAHGVAAEINLPAGYPLTVNHVEETGRSAAVATEIAGSDKVDTDITPTLGSEDFSFMLEERPGSFIFVGNGDTATLHNPLYDFNDDVIPHGCSYWARLVETLRPAA